VRRARLALAMISRRVTGLPEGANAGPCQTGPIRALVGRCPAMASAFVDMRDTAAIDHLASAKLSRMTARSVWGSKW
jgi:hypothetical protein